MRILVTGGAGFIGSIFVRKALDIGMDVTVIDSFQNGSDSRNLTSSSKLKVHRADIRDLSLLKRLAQGHDTVVHFAAETHNDRSIINPLSFFEVNVMGTLNVAMVCEQLGIRLHHVSTDEVFGDMGTLEDYEFDELSRYVPSSPYAASKAGSDHIIRSWVRTYGLQATISNCTNNYGLNQHSEKLIPSTIISLLRGAPPRIYGDGLNVRDWIYVDDHVRGILAVLQYGNIGETYLFSSRNRLSNLDIIRMILEAFGKPEDFFEFVDDRPGHDRKYALNPTKAETELGWKPQVKTVTEVLPQIIEQVRERHFIA